MSVGEAIASRFGKLYAQLRVDECNEVLAQPVVDTPVAKVVWGCSIYPWHSWEEELDVTKLLSQKSATRPCYECRVMSPTWESLLRARPWGKWPELKREYQEGLTGVGLAYLDPASEVEVWWQCEAVPSLAMVRGEGRSTVTVCVPHPAYQRSVRERVAGVGCDYCQGRKPFLVGSLSDVRPDLAKELVSAQWVMYDEGRTALALPDYVYHLSPEKAVWRCGSGHEWKASVYDRVVNNKSCSKCSLHGTSKVEIGLREELRKCLPVEVCAEVARVQGKSKAWTADILIEEWNLIIEYDGWRHGNEESWSRDLRKTKDLEAVGFTVLRVRGEALREWSMDGNVVHLSSYNLVDTVKEVVNALCEMRPELRTDSKVAERLLDDKLWASEETACRVGSSAARVVRRPNKWERMRESFNKYMEG